MDGKHLTTTPVAQSPTRSSGVVAKEPELGAVRRHRSLLPLDYGHHIPSRVNARLRYGSFVSDKHRIIYVETPKAACTALKWILATIEGHQVHLVHCKPETRLEMCIHHRKVHPLPCLNDFDDHRVREMLNSYRTFCVVRNPYSRLVSAWANKIRLREPGYEDVCKDVAAHAGSPGAEITFTDFAKWVVETNDPATCNAHWRSQKQLLYPDIIDYKHVLKVETLLLDLQLLFASIPSMRNFSAGALLSNCHSNESVPLSYGELYDRQLAARVREFYAEDFATYDYDEKSWEALSSRREPSFEEMESAALSAIRQRNTLIAHLAKEVDAARAQADAVASSAARRIPAPLRLFRAFVRKVTKQGRAVGHDIGELVGA